MVMDEVCAQPGGLWQEQAAVVNSFFTQGDRVAVAKGDLAYHQHQSRHGWVMATYHLTHCERVL